MTGNSGTTTTAAGWWDRLAYPVCLAAAMTAAGLALAAGATPLAVFAVVTVVTLAFVCGGEALRAFHTGWRPHWRDNYVPDGVTFVVNNLLLQSPAVQLVVSGLAISLAGGGLQVWPHHWPMWLQVPLALVLGEFGAYWWHRASHELPWLWRFHKVHHSPRRLYWLNATRFHYVDVTLLQSCSVLPVLLLGGNQTAVLFITLFSIFHGYWQHGNTRQALGPLNYILANAELHRWHHNENPAVGNHNYGTHLILWDLVFGTFLWPERGHGDAHGASIADIGIAERDYPENPFRLLVQPFLPQPRALPDPGGEG